MKDLALLYRNIGDYNKALLYFQQVLAIRKKALGEEHQDYGHVLKHLAMLYHDMEAYDIAFSYYRKALVIFKKKLGEEHLSYAYTLSRLGTLHYDTREYNKALSCFKEALAIRKKAVGEDHLEYTGSLDDMAILYKETGKYEEALSYYQQALDIRKKVVGEEHPRYSLNLINLALLNTVTGNATEAATLLMKASALTLRHLSRTYSTLSEQEKMAFLGKGVSQFSYLPSLCFTHKTVQSSMLQQVYQNELALKGMVLENQKDVLSSIRISRDNTTLRLYEQWRLNKAFLGKQLLLPIKQRVHYPDSLEEVTNQLEQQISHRSLAFSNQQQSQNITITDIAQKLKIGEAAIEFIRFPLYNKKWTDSVMYAAMLLLPGDSVARFIPLCEEKQLLGLLRPSANAVTDDVAIEQLYGNERGAGTLSDSLYQLTWKPLEKYLDGMGTIYYAPAGLLHRISFQALRSDVSHFLIDKYRLNQVLSTRSIVLPVQEGSKPLSASVWGNINYTMNNSIASRQRTRGQQSTRGQNTVDNTGFSFNFYNADTRDFRGGSEWESLPSTRQEMDSLKMVFQNNGISITSFSGSSASEESFKTLDGKSPKILHLATHGFSLPIAEIKSKTNSYDLSAGYAFKVQQNPMFRSGLVLAGGNNAWRGEPAIPGKEDGILTAYEIAQMDLSNTDLVVLSACETALGDVQGTEGVIGLQRAFKMSGAKQVLVSLWSVYDKPTMELMTLFYRNRLSGLPTREALRNAQLKIKEKYADPYYWAGFVLIE